MTTEKQCYARRHMTLQEFAIYDLCVTWSRDKDRKIAKRYPEYGGKPVVLFDGPQITSEFGEVGKSMVYKIAASLREAGWLVLVRETTRIGNRNTPRHFRVVDHTEWAKSHPTACEGTRAVAYAGRVKSLSTIETPSTIETSSSILETIPSTPGEQGCLLSQVVASSLRSEGDSTSQPVCQPVAAGGSAGVVDLNDLLPTLPIGQLLHERLEAYGKDWDAVEREIEKEHPNSMDILEAALFYYVNLDEYVPQFWNDKISAATYPMAFVRKSASAILEQYEQLPKHKREDVARDMEREKEKADCCREVLAHVLADPDNKMEFGPMHNSRSSSYCAKLRRLSPVPLEITRVEQGDGQVMLHVAQVPEEGPEEGPEDGQPILGERDLDEVIA